MNSYKSIRKTVEKKTTITKGVSCKKTHQWPITIKKCFTSSEIREMQIETISYI